jgi:hypothetical protein
MAPNRMIARWLRPALALFALGGVLALGGCGGGSGAPNNPYAPGPATPGPLSVLPAIVTAYSNTPVTLTISGGAPPYFVVSSNSAVLPVASASNGTIVLLPGNVVTDTAVTITVQDAIGQRATSTVTVKAAPIFGTLTIRPNSATCGSNAICSGQTGTASVTVTGPGGVALPNRQVRFDVVAGAFGIQSSNPATPLVSTLTVVSDGNGLAQVIIQANVGAPTQPATIRATELTSGEQILGSFIIAQFTDGSAILSVSPESVTVAGPDSSNCSKGIPVNYYIFGGTPPYRVVADLPTLITLIGSPVQANGGSFTAITNGCVPLETFTISDATGRFITATISSVLGTDTTGGSGSGGGDCATFSPPNPNCPSVSPAALTLFACPPVPGSSASALITGGTPPYLAGSSDPAIFANVVGANLLISRQPGTVLAPVATVTVSSGSFFTNVPVSVSPTTCP